ncbi:hypothetical protein FGO68_gene2473 [Halteria grandinella]|uniref:Uncharacterized protein n=1 Tax=Halteria grandinella TaxID=5974 RepID=A0A8J8NYR2_HALGN|nr:hypothetical protein FGO68_gene2473 [Halteria grandinella]
MLLYLGATGHQLSEQDFKSSILHQFEQDKSTLSFDGFMLLIRSIINAKGPQALIQWLTNLGYVYSHELQTFVTERSRVYTLTIHSNQQLGVTQVDTLLEDQEPEFESTEQQIVEQGREIYSNGALKMHCSFHENINVYSFLASNESTKDPIIACIDLSDFAGVVQTSTQSLIRQKTIEPREKAFMFHAKIVDAEFKDPLRPMISYRKI